MTKQINEKETVLTRIFWRVLTDWFMTGTPLISRISSPTWSVAWRWIIPPCMIRATMHLPSSFIFSVIPCKRQQKYTPPTSDLTLLKQQKLNKTKTTVSLPASDTLVCNLWRWQSFLKLSAKWIVFVVLAKFCFYFTLRGCGDVGCKVKFSKLKPFSQYCLMKLINN